MNLLPRPFCGGHAGHHFDRIQCGDCLCGTPWIGDREKRIARWNRRAPNVPQHPQKAVQE